MSCTCLSLSCFLLQPHTHQKVIRTTGALIATTCEALLFLMILQMMSMIMREAMRNAIYSLPLLSLCIPKRYLLTEQNRTHIQRKRERERERMHQGQLELTAEELKERKQLI